AGRPAPVIYIGAPCHSRKAVVILSDKTGESPRIVIKAPLGTGAAANILHEADILSDLSKAKPGLGPRILFVNRTKGVTAQEMIDGQPTGRDFTEAHFMLLSKLFHHGKEASFRERASSLLDEMETMTNISESASSLLNRLINIIDSPVKLPAVWIHGDFAPWNIKLSGGRLTLVDWENSCPTGLPLHDIFHFHYMQSYLFNINNDPMEEIKKIYSFDKHAGMIGVDGEIYKKLALCYLGSTMLSRIKLSEKAHAAFISSKIYQIMDGIK
ncbi:MAG TPA: hypothetical protein ENI77_00100, partial [Nitrospirae bacterium]|nr:hypothetical protein [Nitrospirota bacterium]